MKRLYLLFFLLYCLQTYTGVEASNRNEAFLPAPNGIGGIGNIRWAVNGTQLDPHTARIRLPSTLANVMKTYCDRVGITDLFRKHLVEQELYSGAFQQVQLDDSNWILRKPTSKRDSNMHILSAHDSVSHARYMSLLAAGGFDTVLETVGRFYNLEEIYVYGASFIAVTHRNLDIVQTHFEKVHEMSFNILIPIQLKEGSRPELLLKTSDGIVALYHEHDIALVLGNQTQHGTALLDYRDSPEELCLYLSIHLAGIHGKNIDSTAKTLAERFYISEVVQSFLNSERHWKKDGSVQLSLIYNLTDDQRSKLGLIDDMDEPPDWTTFNRDDLFDYFECDEYFQGVLPIPDEKTWLFLRETYEKVVGFENSSISPISDQDGFMVKVHEAYSPGRGRGLFTGQFIPEGTLIYENRQKAFFPTSMSYRRFLMELPTNLACDYLGYVYVQTVGGDETDTTVSSYLFAELDRGVFFNGGLLPTAENIKAGKDLANSGCTMDPLDVLNEDYCDGYHYYAWRDIEEGEELFLYYEGWGEGKNSAAWVFYNLACIDNCDV
jgi:hypothetical protein